MPAKRQPIEIGKRYGLLTIIGESQDRIYPDGSVSRVIIMQCDCGTVKPMLYSHRFKYKSCGCSRRNDVKELVNEGKKRPIVYLEKREVLIEISNIELELFQNKFSHKTFYNKLESMRSLTDTFLK